ncbi:SRPBCC family protein [Pseudacidobacterium ailaaui]|jgi:ligand-binding SRPBCC domain-containing protein|uniref:SRPBCC family protein n=1 Tax=Pseudacidobacterium ailaaui TaxID=1382359 RepID=UPI00047C98E2|nr:SRPBCC family protein [Pseudacidobacterium ailaaui]MBX6359722.1 SRPBCC family protein [Pseudacidobacterium ailaaui]MCL6463136.1 SRPBCC family protein [Pseudacidobacterium ailaaui]MDI3255287.1 SRPBCC family protein [Bacillota bacterium]
MTTYQIEREQQVFGTLSEVFGFFSNAENLAAITPPWLDFHILTPLPIEMKEGALIAYSLRVHGIRFRWLTRIERWQSPLEFVDVQLEGPYRLWRHTHCFIPNSEGVLVKDCVEFALPFGVLGRLAYHFRVSRDLKEIFDYRAQQIAERFPHPG